MTTHPDIDRFDFAPVEQHAIYSPQVRISLHLVRSLGHFNGIFAIAINRQRSVLGGETENRQHCRNFGAVIGGGGSFGNMAKAFNTRSLFCSYMLADTAT